MMLPFPVACFRQRIGHAEPKLGRNVTTVLIPTLGGSPRPDLDRAYIAFGCEAGSVQPGFAKSSPQNLPFGSGPASGHRN